MSLDSLTYLIEAYWPFLLAALLIGVVVGWLSHPRGDSEKAR